MIQDNAGFYYRHGELSFDFDDEHQDYELAGIEFVILKNYLEDISNALHLFCGAGRHVLEFSKHNIQSVGLDISSYLICRANELLKKEKCLNANVLCANVLNLPFHEKQFQCVTALGNSICLLTGDQLKILFLQIKKVVKKSGLFLMDMPDFHWLIEKQGMELNSGSMTKEFISNKFGPGQFTWERSYHPDKNMICSNEEIVFALGEHNEKRLKSKFCFNTLYPDDVKAIANTFRLEHLTTISYEDPREIYRGMLKKRLFMVFQNA
ncbi:MAG: class I SAM-dependent methyltransferase [Desulfobacterales bacterium]|nr:class I SAM-dependent methyltransferase [Desulfobacterales bacterium]